MSLLEIIFKKKEEFEYRLRVVKDNQPLGKIKKPFRFTVKELLNKERYGGRLITMDSDCWQLS